MAPSVPGPRKPRSRGGCWPCKQRKVKCDEGEPVCRACVRRKETCDYGIRLTWGGRGSKDGEGSVEVGGAFTFDGSSAVKRARRDGNGGAAEGDQEHKFAVQSEAAPYAFSSMSASYSPTAASSATSISQTESVRPDLRRVTINSLLEDSPDTDSGDQGGSGDASAYTNWDRLGVRVYGYDFGAHDFDIPHNNDFASITHTPSEAKSRNEQLLQELKARNVEYTPNKAFDEPLPLKIPRIFEPLPRDLVTKPMNMLYFHHYFAHTAPFAMSHDCPENPFRGVLAQLAMHNPHLLNLLLSYAACHRAKMLHYPVPRTRVAEWMSGVLPALREALNDTSEPSEADSFAAIAPIVTASMLASIEIFSPNIFGISIPWRRHLETAKQLILVRGGGLNRLAQYADGVRDKSFTIISKWLTCLDIMGALSTASHPILGPYELDGTGSLLVHLSPDEMAQVDCFLGVSGRCTALIARTAELVADCDRMRREDGEVKKGEAWRGPPLHIKAEAEELLRQLHESARTYQGCCHLSKEPATGSTFTSSPATTTTSKTSPSPPPTNPSNDSALTRLYATNTAHHHAATLTLNRRVLALSPTHPLVRTSIQQILTCMRAFPIDSTANACIPFAIFTAGCEAQDETDRTLCLERLEAVRDAGWVHVGRACEVMREVWERGVGWEELVDGSYLF